MQLEAKLRKSASQFAKKKLHGAYEHAFQEICCGCKKKKKNCCKLRGFSRTSTFKKCKGIKENVKEKLEERRKRKKEARPSILEREVVYSPTFFIDENEKVKTKHTDVLFSKLVRKTIA
jgi:hypothetical protein